MFVVVLCNSWDDPAIFIIGVFEEQVALPTCVACNKELSHEIMSNANRVLCVELFLYHHKFMPGYFGSFER